MTYTWRRKLWQGRTYKTQEVEGQYKLKGNLFPLYLCELLPLHMVKWCQYELRRRKILKDGAIA